MSQDSFPGFIQENIRTDKNLLNKICMSDISATILLTMIFTSSIHISISYILCVKFAIIFHLKFALIRE